MAVSRRGVLRLPFAAFVPAVRRVAMVYEVTVGGDASAPVSLWMPAPQSNAHQTIEALRLVDAPGHRMHAGAHGNRYFHAMVPARHKVRMEFRATRRERVATAKAGAQTPACCLGPDRLVPIDGRIRQWAREVVGPARTDMDKARAIYEHVVATVKYDKSGKGWGRGDIYYACDARRGNCSDFHAIFIGYARAVGIPAQFTIGVPLPRTGAGGEISGYHCWAEFFAAGVGWVPVDASEAAKDPARRNYFFGALDEHRVEFSKGRDLVLTPAQAGEPLNFFVYGYAEQGGKRLDGVETRITYRAV